MAVSAQQSCQSPAAAPGDASPVPPAQQGTAYLESLADALTQRGLRTRLIAPPGRIPSLHVVNPAASVLAEDIYAGQSQDGTWWFWWSWAERIGVSEDTDAAAARIAIVLAPHE
jgi:hypothetical protein